MIEAPALLLLHNSPPVMPSTVAESVDAFRRHSSFPVFPVNTVWGLPDILRRMRFSAVILHFSLFYADFEPLSPTLLDVLVKNQTAFNVAFFQDEQAYLSRRQAFCDEFSIDCVYTCLEEPYASQVYSPGGNRKVITYLPGYVSEPLRKQSRRVLGGPRPIDIGYRGRKPPPEWSGAAIEKYEIAVGFSSRARHLGLNLDIETDGDKRIYGDDWLRFLASCKSTLGAESGADIAAPDGLGLGTLPYRTIGPRHFEAAATETCQILFEGSYSGAIEARAHYIPLRKDFANFNEVIELFRDEGERTAIASRARRHLIDSGAFEYGAFVASFDDVIRESGAAPPSQRFAVGRSRVLLDASRLGRQGRRVERKARRELAKVRARLR